jgi:ATP-dependent helicase/DNAse subunit B
MAADGQLGTFYQVWQKPGFLDMILDWIREMKSQGIMPETYTNYAEEQGGDQDRQLASIYQRYQAFMQTQKYSDPDGLLWLAAETLETNLNLYRRRGSFYVLGFDQFTPVQLRILRSLADRVREAGIYLLGDGNRPLGSPALVRLRRTQESLQDFLNLKVETLAEAEVDVPEQLRMVHQRLFDQKSSEGVSEIKTKTGEKDLEDSLRLVEAPSRDAEVRWTLRLVKQLLIQGTSPLEVAILVANSQTYLPIIRTVAEEYHVPVQYEYPLVTNPAAAALATLLRLPGRFPWAETLDALRSPYIRQGWLSVGEIETLERLSRERPVVEGRGQWDFAVQPLSKQSMDSEDDDFGPPPLAVRLPDETLQAIQVGLKSFFEHVTPPDSASHRAYTWWLQTKILGYQPEETGETEEQPDDEDTLDMWDCCQEGSHVSRDTEALAKVMKALRSLLVSTERVPGQEEVTWETYRDEVLTLLGATQFQPEPKQGGVRFEVLGGGRARPVAHLFVLGLSEGEFPTPPAPDPLYAPSERENHPLPLLRHSPADEASLWWQVTGSVRQRLVLMRPYIDENGAPWQPSPYWDAVRDCLGDPQIERLPIAEGPDPEQAASQGELLTALARSGAQVIPQSLKSDWDYAKQAAGIIQQRESYEPSGIFEGIFKSVELKTELQARYGEKHIWSASRLNRYAYCPYGFFAENVLKLEAHPDPEEGMDVLQRGSLLHAILERLYMRLTETNIAPTLANLDKILVLLEETCAAILPAAPRRYGFRPGALWAYEQDELQRLVGALVTWECQLNGEQARFMPALQECRFGIGPGEAPTLEIRAEGIHFLLRGVIDRIDKDRQGNLRVIDYKSGGGGYSKPDMLEGLAMQAALYALAAERFWLQGQGRVAESQYWHIPNRETSGKLTFKGRVREDEVVEGVIQQAVWCVAQVRAGFFPSAPAKPVQWGKSCANRCDFSAICRVSRQSIFKNRQGGSQ